MVPSLNFSEWPLHAFKNKYHLGDFYTLTSPAAKMRYNHDLEASGTYLFCALRKQFPDDFISVILVFLKSQIISQFQLTNINCPSNSKILLQWCWFLVNHSWLFSPSWPELQNLNSKQQSALIESLNFPLKCPKPGLSSALLSTFISSKVPKNFPLSSKHSMAFLAQTSKVYWYQILFGFLVSVSIAVMKHCDQTASYGWKGLFGLQFHIIVHRWRKLGQVLKQEAGTDAEAMERCCLLTYSACFLSNQPLPNWGWCHPQSAVPSCINH